MSKNSFLWVVVYAFIFGLTLGVLAFGQDGAAVDIQPLVEFDAVFEPMKQFFTDILKEYWVFLLSMFFVWFAVMCGLSYLDGVVQRRLAIRRRMIEVRDNREAANFERETRLENERVMRNYEANERYWARYDNREFMETLRRRGEENARATREYANQCHSGKRVL